MRVQGNGIPKQIHIGMEPGKAGFLDRNPVLYPG